MLENINLFGENLGTNVNNPTVLQDIFDILHPINEVIIQYPHQKSPVELFNDDSIVSVWEEQLQYNSAFFRSNRPPTELWSPDNTHFYRSASKSSPVNVSGISGGTRTSVTEYNSEEGLTYTKWTGWSRGKGKDFNDILDLQDNQNQYHKHDNTVKINQQPVFSFSNAGIDFSVESRGGPSWGFGAIMLVQWIFGEISLWYSGGAKNTMYTSGSYPLRSNTYLCSHRHILDNSKTTTATVNYSNVYAGTSGDEARPDNYTFKIWKRIA